MRRRLLRHTLLLFLSTPLTAAGLVAQELSFGDLFSNDRFYRDNGILKAEGEIGFLADLWILPTASDSARALLAVSLSNSDLQFERTESGGWQADYQVAVRFEGDDAPPPKSWDQSVEVAAFDETLLAGETIVFSWIVYKSRAHRDKVNAKVMADERLKKMPKVMPFDVKRMAYGGFKVLVDA